NYRVSSGLTDLLEQFKEDGQVEMLVARRGALSKKIFPIVHRRSSNWKLQPVSEPSEQQKSRLADWLHQPPEESSDTSTAGEAEAAN
ncbi:MAG: hypothetical protein AAGG44_16095, partial [Planctomycetota bacterium]